MLIYENVLYFEKFYISLSWTLISQILYKNVVTDVHILFVRMLQKVLAV